ncbi:hypothetical protein OAS14_00700 [Alphaproteobacteria bacterium]|nr:hypothetical protein [Alphaproteobacteria bacterium]
MTATCKTVYIVHCVDTEGPLYESLEATSERIEQVFGIKVDLDAERLQLLKSGIGVPAEIASQVRAFLSRLNYMDTWDKLDAMHQELFSKEVNTRFGSKDFLSYDHIIYSE